MASHILPFPLTPASRAPKAEDRHKDGTAPPAERDAHEAKRPQLIHSNRQVPGRGRRRSDSQVQACHIVTQVEREIAERVQRQRAERSELRRAVPTLDPRARQGIVPTQATEVGLRQRLQDALFLFLRLA